MENKELFFLTEQAKNICSMKIKKQEKLINDNLYNVSVEFNPELKWINDGGVKYFISYNNISKRFGVEPTWTTFVTGVVYFSDKQVANKALIENEKNMNNLIELYSLYSKLCSEQLGVSEVNKLKDIVLYHY